MTRKIYLDAQDLLEDAFRLGAMVVRSGFRPTHMLAIWRGGSPIGTAVQEILAYNDIPTDHIAIRTASYSDIDSRAEVVRVYGLNYLARVINSEDRLLIVDDVFDTGHTIDAVIAELTALARRNTPRDIRVAVPWYKPARRKSEREPDYFIHQTDDWIKFPHSLEGLEAGEIRSHRPELYEILAPYLDSAATADPAGAQG